jgi:hypothetical protein
MENNLEVAAVEEAEKVLFTTHYLSGAASSTPATSKLFSI